MTAVFDTVGSGKYPRQANDVVDVDGKCHQERNYVL